MPVSNSSVLLPELMCLIGSAGGWSICSTAGWIGSVFGVSFLTGSDFGTSGALSLVIFTLDERLCFLMIFTASFIFTAVQSGFILLSVMVISWYSAVIRIMKFVLSLIPLSVF